VKIPALFFASLLLVGPLAQAQETYGTIRSTTKLRPDGSKSTTVLDPDKRTAEETIYDARDKPMKKITYLLGEKDLAIGAIFADGKGNVSYKASYQRDGYGRVVESSFTSPDGRHLGKRVFSYGAGDKVTLMQDYDAQGQLITPAQPVKKRR